MRKFLSKIWFPALLVFFACIQMVGSDFSRAGIDGQRGDAADTVIYKNERIYIKFRKEGSRAEGDSLEGVLSVADSIPEILARDTIKIPDSLKFTDPFRYKWYLALVDSLTHRQVIDSLKAAGDDSLRVKIDSIYFSDSTALAKLKFEQWYNSLSKEERKRYNDNLKLKRQQRQLDSLFNIKDSLQHVKDSIRENTPRILETFALPDSMWYKRVIYWNRDNMLANVYPKLIDTTSNHWYNDYRFLREDVGATYPGTIGSPYQSYNYFKREYHEGVSFYQEYEGHSYSPETLPMYNTKTPYTELAYWGNLFSNTEREESQIHILASQNIHPEFNVSLMYDRVGSNGMLDNERVDNRTFAAWLNYAGKKYLAHAGIINNSIKKHENGGMEDSFWIRDTTVGSREIPVNLENASSKIVKNTIFVDQQYRFPLPFLAKIFGRQTDSLSSVDVTSAFLGHSSEYSNYSRIYEDEITGDRGKNYYRNKFYINPGASCDSLHVTKLENRVFAKLQPWSRESLVSTLDVGIGNRILRYYMQEPLSAVHKKMETTWNSSYIYGGASGMLGGFQWEGQAFFVAVGDESGDFGVKAKAGYSFYPFRKARKSPVTIGLGFETSLDEPEFFQKKYYGNHDRWNNDFKKISTTKITGSIDIPHWDFKASAGYALLDGNIFYDTLGIARQNTSPMHVISLAVEKNLKLWKFHFDNRALVQVSSDKEVLPLPPVALNLRWYFQFNISGDVMKMQLGANTTWTPEWYAPTFRPSTGVFHNQTIEKIGNCPYIDAFVNVQWKKACIFVKFTNIGMGWPNESPDYFSAQGYIRPQSGLKLGIWIPFYTSHRKNGKLSDRASSVGK